MFKSWFQYENSNLFSGGQDGIAEYESFNPEDTGELCENNPQDPLCFVQPVGGQGAPGTDIFGPVDGEPTPPGVAPANIGFWGDEQKAGEFKEQTDTFTDFAGNYCDENPDDPTCSSVPPPPPQDGIIQDQDCDDNPYAPGCPQSGGQEGQGPPPEGEGIDCGDPSNSALPQCTNPEYDGEEYVPPAGGDKIKKIVQTTHMHQDVNLLQMVRNMLLLLVVKLLRDMNQHRHLQMVRNMLLLLVVKPAPGDEPTTCHLVMVRNMRLLLVVKHLRDMNQHRHLLKKCSS